MGIGSGFDTWRLLAGDWTRKSKGIPFDKTSRNSTDNRIRQDSIQFFLSFL